MKIFCNNYKEYKFQQKSLTGELYIDVKSKYYYIQYVHSLWIQLAASHQNRLLGENSWQIEVIS